MSAADFDRWARHLEVERRKFAAGWLPCIVVGRGIGDAEIDALIWRATHAVIRRWVEARP